MQRTLREGMRVRTADGQELGTVVRCEDESFVVREPRSLRERVLRYEEVGAVREGEVHLSGALSGGTAAPVGGQAAPFGEPREVVLELATEEVIPEKVVREVGQLRITKVVRTEERLVRVSVRREEVHIERVDAERVDAAAGQAQAVEEPVQGELQQPFDEGTLVIPLYEERVEVTKRPYVWQEVRVSKVVEEALREFHTTVRRETAQVEGAEEAPPA